MNFMIVTNNPQVRDRYEAEGEAVLFQPGSILEIMTAIRDLVHQGHKLLTHPLSGSVKPGHTPYKSVLVSTETGTTDMDSVLLIESAFAALGKFQDRSALYSDAILQDYQMVDADLIGGAIESARKDLGA